LPPTVRRFRSRPNGAPGPEGKTAKEVEEPPNQDRRGGIGGRIQPGNAKLRANLGSVLASRGEFPEARYDFEQSIRLKPDYPDTRLNYARTLASINETGEAEKQAQAAVESDAGMTGAHQLLGALLATRGDLDGAERELRTAVLQQPELWRA